jgi:hypothetical protein
MPKALPDSPPVRTIRFSRRVEDACAPAGPLPEWAVCDAIANGDRKQLQGRGPSGGKLLRFRRAYPGARTGGPALVVVLGEVDGGCCLALQASVRRPGKICAGPDF